MRWNVVLFILFFCFASLPALADIAAIHADALPQETAVLAALDDARQLEPYGAGYTPEWKYPIPKKEVADRLEKDLGLLTVALQNHPDNAELALLTGLVADYAYNLDVPDSHEKAVAAFETARKLAPSDIRAPWFHAHLLCQTVETKPGMEKFLSIEATHPLDQLPEAFWQDYMYCATVTSMPAHVLRAASYLDKLHAPQSNVRTLLVDTARKRFDAFDPNKKYDPRDVWQGANDGADTQFTSTMCGVHFSVPATWSVNRLALSNNSCVAYFSTGPYKAVTTSLRPSILLMIQQATAGETLQDHLRKFTKDGTFEPFTPSRCPSKSCLAEKGLQPGMYKVDGDGHGHILVFERDQPEFPGLIFESPLGAPQSNSDEGPKYYRPGQIRQRIPGKLFYLVLVDMAASIEDPAMKDFDLFLQDLTVE
ncbi:MAG TPA: hypothetical protein VMU48_05410 [Terracidiphilus sp.]|nr:hypothetical protein [Terracidiphilus sp.]